MSDIFYHFTSRESAFQILSDGFHHVPIWLADAPKLALGYCSNQTLLEVRIRGGRKAISAFERSVDEEVLDGDFDLVIETLNSAYSFWEVPGDILNSISCCRIISDSERREMMI